MEISSYFIEDKCLFGPYPSNTDVKELEKNGVKYFVDLTSKEDKLDNYNCDTTYISYPIKDNSIPDDKEDFLNFLDYIKKVFYTLPAGDKIYIHCKGGHGRSGMLVACLLCCILGLRSEESISKTSESHNKRPLLKKSGKIQYVQTIKNREIM